MSRKEIDRLEVVRRVLEKRLFQVKAAELIGLSTRQTRRLCSAYEHWGPTALASRKRGMPSNRRLPAELALRATAIVRELYSDFGPTLAREKLMELHGVHVGKETLRSWMMAAEIWLTRAKRLPKVHQPRHRRSCFGELVQIDGSPHTWFEDRAGSRRHSPSRLPRCPPALPACPARHRSIVLVRSRWGLEHRTVWRSDAS